LIFVIIDFVGIDSKTLKEEKREELFETLKTNDSIGWAVDVIDPRELSAKMLKK
jgi:ribonuclease H2 subunit A